MGFITNAIGEKTSSIRSSIGNECSTCTGKAVAGMESANDLATRDTNQADQASAKVVDGEQYVVMSGPVGNLFTKALDVKFANGDPRTELNTERSIANESAAQDTFMQHRQMQLRGANAAVDITKSISSMQMGKSIRYLPAATNVNASRAAMDALLTNPDTQWLFVFDEGRERIDYPMISTLAERLRNAPGVVPGLKESVAIESEGEDSEVTVDQIPEIAAVLSKLRVKGVKIIVEVEKDE